MTGAGSASLAFAKESSFGSLPADPTYYLPGRNPVVQNLSLQNQLARMRTPDNAEAVDSLAGNLEGAIAVSYAMSADTHEHVQDIVFNDGGTGFDGAGHATTSRWYLGVDYMDSVSTTATAERVLKSTIPLEYQLQYQQGTNTVQETLTMGYADEEKNTAITPGSITGPTDGNDVPFHGTSLTVDGATVEKLQSAQLSFSNLSRFHRDASRTAVDAVCGPVETSLDMAAIYSTNDYLEAAYGGDGATSPQDQLASVAGELEFDVDGTSVATYTLPKLKPDSYEWADLIAGDTDLTDPVTYHVNGGVTVA